MHGAGVRTRAEMHRQIGVVFAVAEDRRGPLHGHRAARNIKREHIARQLHIHRTTIFVSRKLGHRLFHRRL